jgi:nucleoside-diphosphate-sugar epimerase
VTDNVYEYLVERQSVETYEQRTTDLIVVKTGKEMGVRTYIIMAPPVYGQGTGHFNTLSTQIPLLINKAIDAKKAMYVGNGDGHKDKVHVSDLANAYEIFLSKILEDRESIPSGERGIYFAANGRYTWKSLANQLARIGFELGQLDSPTPVSISIEEALAIGLAPTEQKAELNFASK